MNPVLAQKTVDRPQHAFQGKAMLCLFFVDMLKSNCLIPSDKVYLIHQGPTTLHQPIVF